MASHRGRVIQHGTVLWLKQIIKSKSRRKQGRGYGSMNGGAAARPLGEVNSLVAPATAHRASRIVLGKRPRCSLPSFCKQTRLVSPKQLRPAIKSWPLDSGGIHGQIVALSSVAMTLKHFLTQAFLSGSPEPGHDLIEVKNGHGRDDKTITCPVRIVYRTWHDCIQIRIHVYSELFHNTLLSVPWKQTDDVLEKWSLH